MDGLRTTNDLPETLWTASNVLQLKTEKAVGAVLAVGRTLALTTERRKHEEEFLALYHWALTVDADAFQRVLGDPRAYHWGRLAFQLLSAVRSKTKLPPTARTYLDALDLGSADEGLAFHLEQFKIFAIALALADGRSIAFSPVPVQLPLAVPSAPWSFSGTADVKLRGYDPNAGILAIVDGREMVLPLPSVSMQLKPGLTVNVAPQLQFANNTLVLQPHAFHVPGLSSIASVVQAGVPFQWQVLDLVHHALQAIQQYDVASYEQFIDYMRVVALKPETDDEVYNTSCSRLPGAAIFTAYHHPLVLADDLIHEYYHNRLFALEEAGDFFEHREVDPICDERFYSPWRTDPRPLYGLFHGEYVMERVLGFWLSVLADSGLDRPARGFAECRAACLLGQLETATAELRAFATFTEFGQRLFDGIAAAIEEKLWQVRALGISGDVPAWMPNADGTFAPVQDEHGRQLTVDDVLLRHIERYDVFGRCRPVADDRFCIAEQVH